MFHILLGIVAYLIARSRIVTEDIARHFVRCLMLPAVCFFSITHYLVIKAADEAGTPFTDAFARNFPYVVFALIGAWAVVIAAKAPAAGGEKPAAAAAHRD
jgi:hypothetical protein